MGTGDISRAMIENTKETAIDVEVINAQPYPVPILCSPATALRPPQEGRL